MSDREWHPQLWDQMVGESREAYRAFTIFRDLGPGRTIIEAARIYSGNRAHTGGSHIHRWAMRWEWERRANAWDAWLRTVYQTEVERRERDAAATWVERRKTIREQEYQLGQELIKRVYTMLQYPLVEEKLATETVTDPVSGLEYATQVTILTPVRWTANTARLMIETASQVMRLGADMPTSKAALTGGQDADGVDKPLTLAFIDRLRDVVRAEEYAEGDAPGGDESDYRYR